MFGYVIPMQGELKVRELEQFRSAYCGLCHTLGQRYGLVSRFLLNYDFTFLAMLLSPGAPVCCQGRRCVASPFRRRQVCPPNPGMELAADESVILTWWKLRDQVEDEPFWRGLPARLGTLALRRAYRRAAQLRPDFDRQVRLQLDKLRRLERDQCPSLDRPADTFAGLLASAAAGEEDELRRRALEQLLYHVGRWIYLVDAWDDLEEDLVRGGYNPAALRYDLTGGGDRSAAAGQLRLTLQHSRNLALSAFYLLEEGSWTPILLNILCLGLAGVEELVLTGQWKQRKKTIRRENRR